MTNKIKLNRSRIEEILRYRAKTWGWLNSVTIQQNGKIGITRQTMSNYLSNGFAVQTALSISDALGVSVDYLQSGISEDILICKQTQKN